VSVQSVGENAREAANRAVWGGPKAEAIYDQGREAVVVVLLGMGEQIGRLTERVARQDERIAELERRLGRSSRNSFLPPARTARRGAEASQEPDGPQAGEGEAPSRGVRVVSMWGRRDPV
jgi:hypothetical protein